MGATAAASTGPPTDARLAELLAALSLAADLGNDFPPEKTLRTCVLATALAGEMRLSLGETHDVYYAALLRFIGCSATAHELAQRFGDDNRVRATAATIDRGHPAERLRALRALEAGRGLLDGLRVASTMTLRGDAVYAMVAGADCEVSAHAAERMGVGGETPAVLLHSFARWDGHGRPQVAGDAVDRRARVVHVASFAETHHRVGGPRAALDAIARGAGGWFDPDVAATFARRGPDLLALLGDAGASAWDAVLAAEPRAHRRAAPADVDAVARAFADLVDLKSTYRLGHSSAVAQLAEKACVSLGLPASSLPAVRRAALLHDLGMYSVPTGILDKPGPLSAPEWERVRLHAYHTERVLARTPLFADAARIASLHHERLDGSGYHRGERAAQLPMAARVLAAADVLRAMREPRAHRPALGPDAAAREMQDAVTRGALDGEAVRAVCEAAGTRAPPRSATAGPAGLSEREIEVLRLLARGRSKKEIGKALFIAHGTVHTHVTHIYEKLGVSSRAAAAVFAMEHGLLPD